FISPSFAACVGNSANKNSCDASPSFRHYSIPMKELLSDFRVRRLLLANITGSVGSGVTIVAVPWLLVQRPGGDRLYGYVTIAITIAVFALIPHYGAWLDRHSRKLALLLGEAFGAITTLTMATWIALAGHAATWQFLVLYAGGILYYTLHFP